MKWLTRINPLSWFRGAPVQRDITYDQLAQLGLVPARVGGETGPTSAAEAMGISAVFCADRVIAEDLASSPMCVYGGHRLEEGAKPLYDDPVTQLLARPNPEMTGPVFWSQFQHNANIWGFAVAEIARDGAGRPRELWPLESHQVRIDRDGYGRLTFEAPEYSAPVPSGRYVKLDAADVLFLPGFTPDGSVGYQLLNTARMTFGMAISAQRYGTARFKNGLNPSGVIEHTGVLSEPAANNMRNSWRALYGGAAGIGTPMILEEGTKWNPFTLAHNDQLQLAELCEWLVDEVARFFNISPVKLHKLGRATWSNLEQLNRDHVTTTLGPWIAKRDAEIDLKLLGPGRHCRHITDRLLIADTQTRFAAWNAAITGGWMKPNEARAREDLPPEPGGDVLLRPLNSAPAASPAKPTTTPEAPNDGPPGTDPARAAG
ncbi:HK97 family phage portal protein OS=Lachnospiraceae bacterium COE1 GN=C809_04329 PE=4 SV=1: Phage_portal [Gemmataceae bacterium]|nr:HK97 family phage portal protein OS=Lachnospiraceae bacterium COE1 GN=C809_04329 PE=4 SV=1: Phage_portal [Gemmataceae bacterium]VTU02783.1 HK97 family phage portal protein OS=Lachnospiraceae bacterium COE1 GN=C809_04329 PE=4 SV=1: Phage_portal [Gemmataceae bacterium]